MIRADGLAAIAMAQEDYPLRVIFGLLHKTLTDFDVRHPTWKSDEHDMDQEGKDEKMSDLMKQDLIQFQDPLKVDKLLQAQKSLEDVKTILTKNIDEILNREEKLTSLMAKSKDLSEYSKGFQTKAKKMNQCCKAY
jgi:synaptobrevin family protein YKT6